MGSDRPGALILGSDVRALAAVRALGRRGIASFVVDPDPRSAWLSRYPVGRERWPGTMHGDLFRDFLIELARRRELDGWVLFALQDETVATVAREAAELSRWYRLTTPTWEVARRVLDKRLTNELAAAAGVPHPRTWYPNGPRDLLELRVTYPVLVKPTMSTWLQHALHRKALWAHDEKELRAAYDVLARLVPPHEIVIQEAIPGDGSTQLSAVVICKAGEVLGGMTAVRRRQYPFDLGLNSCFVEAVPLPGLMTTAATLSRHLGLSGVAEMEFKHDHRQDVDKLLDINVRLWGWHGLCVACGLDFTHLLYLQAMGEEPRPGPPVYGRRWRRLATDVPAALQEMRAGILSPSAYLGSLIAGRAVPSVLALDDPLPVLGEVGLAARRAKARSGPRHSEDGAGVPVGRRPAS